MKTLPRVAVLLCLVACSSSKSGSTGAGGQGGTMAGAGGTAGTGGAGGSSGMGGVGSGAGGGGGAGGGPVDAAATDAGGPGGAPAMGASVLERNKNPSRDGNFIQPQLTRTNAAKMVLDPAFNAEFTGAMWASPLYLENGPGGKGLFFAVTIDNDVFALDETTGAQVWKTNVGSAAALPGVPCGNIHPLGILATPVIDAASRTIYVSAAIGTDVIDRDEVHALSVDDGKERPGWPVNVSKAVNFDAKPHNPRSALSLVNGILYVAYGGHIGDCGDYRGRVVAIDTKDPTKVVGWATAGQGEAIWAAGGMASDGDGVIAATGNRIGSNGPHQDSEEVVRLTGMAVKSDFFFPSSWQQMDGTDADFGSSNPILVDVPGATPSKMVVAIAKDGHIYFLDSKKLGGMGGQLADFVVASNSMSIWTAPTAYATGKGSYVALTIGSSPMCQPSVGGSAVMGVMMEAGAPVKPHIAWCAPSGSASPISTTTDGRSDALVWYMAGGKLNAVDGDTGAKVFTSAGSCDGVRQWTSPIAVKGRIVVGADNRLCAWTIP